MSASRRPGRAVPGRPAVPATRPPRLESAPWLRPIRNEVGQWELRRRPDQVTPVDSRGEVACGRPLTGTLPTGTTKASVQERRSTGGRRGEERIRSVWRARPRSAPRPDHGLRDRLIRPPWNSPSTNSSSSSKTSAHWLVLAGSAGGRGSRAAGGGRCPDRLEGDSHDPGAPPQTTAM